MTAPETQNRRTLLKKRSSPITIGFTAVADFSSFIGQEYVAGVMRAASDYGVNFINMADATRHTLVLNTQFLPQYLTKMQFMKLPLIDGLVTWASSLCEYLPNDEIQRLFSALRPLPMVDIGYLDIPDVPSIRIDNAYSMHLLVEHLVTVHGFRRIAFVGAQSSKPHGERLACFRREMRSFSLPCPDDSIFMAASLDSRDIAVQMAALCQKPLPEAIVTSSDIIASAVIEELEKRHISVPDTVAVTGFNNQLSGIASPVPVTTIDLAYFERGYKAVELLLDHILFADIPVENKRVETSLLIRQSCGCFEQSILAAGHHAVLPSVSAPAPHADKAVVYAYLCSVISETIPGLPEAQRAEMAAILQEELYPPPSNTPRTMLQAFRSLLKEQRFMHADIYDYEQAISRFRGMLLALAGDDIRLHTRAEDIAASLRALLSVYTRYDTLSRHGDSYTIGTMTNFALSLAASENAKQLGNALRFKLSELSIPGIILSLSPFLNEDLGATSIELVIPEPPDDIARMLPYKVREAAFFPKRFFPHGRFSVTLELLFHNGRYMGYAFLQTGSGSLALYDDIKELLSQTFYKLYKKEGRTENRALIITDRTRLTQNIRFSGELPKRSGKLNAESIMDYLIDHLDEMTDLDKMGAFFGLSKSHLTRRVRILTGYSVQTLHELIKIEQAKDLIKSSKMKMNDIASRLGFSNPNYFSNVFKKVTGLSPVAWAERNCRR